MLGVWLSRFGGRCLFDFGASNLVGSVFSNVSKGWACLLVYLAMKHRGCVNISIVTLILRIKFRHQSLCNSARIKVITNTRSANNLGNKKKKIAALLTNGRYSVLEIQLNMKVNKLNPNKLGKHSERHITADKESAVKSTR
ncbi:hypothetical protein DVH24_032527 [Malus domestica]|uniref:Uncharacterized protein n=1 Tax=Malus domestica TaxID=3750 RepID=A0A498J3U9_MALDO|nr:hypothetical protein DVH24_032527 [Malus domestica]